MTHINPIPPATLSHTGHPRGAVAGIYPNAEIRDGTNSAQADSALCQGAFSADLDAASTPSPAGGAKPGTYSEVRS